MTRNSSDATHPDSAEDTTPRGANQSELTRPITVTLRDALLKKLKIVATGKEASASEQRPQPAL